MTIERTTGVNGGGYRISDIVNGEYISLLYLGYTRKEAVSEFRGYVRHIKGAKP